MEENNIEIVEQIMQQKIANFIKENRDMNKKELAKIVEEMINEKESMYDMTLEEIKEKLKNN